MARVETNSELVYRVCSRIYSLKNSLSTPSVGEPLKKRGYSGGVGVAREFGDSMRPLEGMQKVIWLNHMTRLQSTR